MIATPLSMFLLSYFGISMLLSIVVLLSFTLTEDVEYFK